MLNDLGGPARATPWQSTTYENLHLIEEKVWQNGFFRLLYSYD